MATSGTKIDTNYLMVTKTGAFNFFISHLKINAADKNLNNKFYWMKGKNINFVLKLNFKDFKLYTMKKMSTNFYFFKLVLWP